MKNTLLFIALFGLYQPLFSQEKYSIPFFTTSIATTLTVNENYTLNNDDGEPFLLPNSLIARIGFGYQLHRRVLVSLHAGFDHHWGYNINAIPTFGTFRFNITENDGDALFIETSYGKLWRPSSRFSDGNYYGFGIGIASKISSRIESSVRFKYHRKSILGFENNRLDSFSLGIGFSFF
ncbi:MAG: Uncharacterised protein [Polaribacter sp. SA4-10]|nr:MAG: Uncharacterised protein [Polaribacter sp. SA4-10]